jgi:predicted sulfurtransferase
MQGFDRLSVQACKEVVSMGVVDWQTPGSSSLPDAAGSGTGVVLPSGARHVEAAEFHSLLEQACQARSQGHDDERKETVLFDARNLYETQLGRFVAVRCPVRRAGCLPQRGFYKTLQKPLLRVPKKNTRDSQNILAK